jgi:hypothetical protein
LSKRNRLKRLEKIVGAVEPEVRDKHARLLMAWFACKLERFECLRDGSYVAPTDEQRELVARTPYERVQRAFKVCLPVRAFIDHMTRRRRDSSDDEAYSGSSEGL